MTLAADLDGRRILVVRTDRLGDVLLSLPVLGRLREHAPGAYLALLTSAACAPLLEGHPWLDRVLEDGPPGAPPGARGWRRLVETVRAEEFDTALVLRPTLRVALLIWSARIEQRIGTAFRAYSFLFNRRQRLHRRGSGRHELELNLAMAEPLIGPVEPLPPWLPVGASARRWASELLPGPGPFVVLHPGSGGSAREWSQARYAALGARLRERQVGVVVTGGAHERALAEEIAAAAGGISLAGRTSLPQLAAVLAAAAAAVGASTGPIHLAAAVGTPVVALYPPMRDASPERWRPYGADATVLEADAPPCGRCIGERCAVWDCMDTIDADTVLQRLEPWLREREPRGSA